MRDHRDEWSVSEEEEQSKELLFYESIEDYLKAVGHYEGVSLLQGLDSEFAAESLSVYRAGYSSSSSPKVVGALVATAAAKYDGNRQFAVEYLRSVQQGLRERDLRGQTESGASPSGERAFYNGRASTEEERNRCPAWRLDVLHDDDRDLNTWNSERFANELDAGRAVLRCDYYGALNASFLTSKTTRLVMWLMYGLCLGVIGLSFLWSWWLILLLPVVLVKTFLTVRKRTAKDVMRAAAIDRNAMRALRKSGVVWAEWV